MTLETFLNLDCTVVYIFFFFYYPTFLRFFIFCIAQEHLGNSGGKHVKTQKYTSIKGGVRDNLKQKTLFSLIFYGDTA